MKNFDEAIAQTCSELWKISCVLKGMGSMFQQEREERGYNLDEQFGLGHILLTFADQLARQEKLLEQLKPSRREECQLQQD